MKKSKILIKLASVMAMTFCISACATTQVTETEKTNEKSEITTVETTPAVEVVDENKLTEEDEAFIESIKNISIKIVSAPRTSTVGSNFVRPFTIEVKDNEGNIKADYPITLSYPSEKKDGELVYTTEDVKTNENGQYAYTAPTNTFCGCGDFKAYPTPVSDKDDVVKAVEEKAAFTPWVVKSDLATKGCILVVWDFNERGKIQQNSMEIQAEIRSRGIYNVGNAPMSDVSFASKPLEEVYKSNYNIDGVNRKGYMLYGTIKFANPVETTEEGSKCTLIGDFKVVNMPDGSIKLAKQFTQETVADSWWNACTKCKKKLSSQVVDYLLYNLD